ncbi:hypothetical protein C7T94_03910 [Pedobacter yulinensis]|uniref:Methyltransferase FkbM domain-containing protein n=1 Tax=Pedobacter yulinensis TaxID=2126353 RepID=A0A2T3HND8_9SPHI|nr:FkbM family methyltransferase [Pedobacter yulinensis]PST83901.1 hypothetical protein C7T94_03910 [Pedobacter yulinensis]
MNILTEQLLESIRQFPDQEQAEINYYLSEILHLFQRNDEQFRPGLFRGSVRRGHFNRVVAGPFATAIITESANGKLAVPVDDMFVGRQLRFDSGYSIAELEYLKTLVDESSQILVVGAHIGSLVVPLCKLVDQCVAVEANPEIYELLKLNVKMNEISNCKTYNFAASDRKGTIPFIKNRINSGGSKRKPLVSSELYSYDDPSEFQVEAMQLDSQFPDAHFDLIFMDIEGSEYFALLGMPELLKNAKMLVMEFIPHHFTNVAGKDVRELTHILSDFNSLFIPSKNKLVTRDDIIPLLKLMYDQNISEDIIVFKK